jgi:hypothetical protein
MRWIVLALCVWALPVYAQHNHGAGHSEYKDWKSRKAPISCCDERDCGVIDDTEVRHTTTGTQVLISGEWCPVLQEHNLTRGKSPDWSVNHACIRPTGDGCERLLCFTPKGGF